MYTKLFIPLLAFTVWINGVFAQQHSDPAPQDVHQKNMCYSTDILHMDLSIGQINWDEQSITAQEVLNVKAAETTSTLVLDAKGRYEFTDVYLTDGLGQLQYDKDSLQITVQLGRTFMAGEQFSIFFGYTAWPRGTSNVTGGDAGLNFINPLGTIPGKPRELWAQGEPEANSKWFLTHDQLACGDKFSATISVVIPGNYVSLSNGLLTSSITYDTGNKQDRWDFPQEQSSYLYTLIVGDYAIVRDEWNGKPVEYYVEKAYEPYARDIFRGTKDMLTFLSNRLGLEYPWPKYSQIVLRDYPSGAMENTSATTFYERMHGTTRECDAFFSRGIVVPHEMGHHWFGDYVTAPGWPSLTMNEGFANAVEDWWLRHTLGDADADFYRRRGTLGYFAQCNGGDAHPLIDYERASKDIESMFDGHSYQKGGAVLFMLQKTLGDDVFFLALHNYLVAHAYGTGSVEDLKVECEKASGKNLDTFFAQWFYQTGHPVLDVKQTVGKRHLRITIDQTQKAKGWGLYELNIPLTIGYSDRVAGQQCIKLNNRKQKQQFNIRIPKGACVDYVVLDPQRTLLVDWHQHSTLQHYEKIAFMSRDYVSRLEACDTLIKYKDQYTTQQWQQLSTFMMTDPDWRFQFRGIDNYPAGHPEMDSTFENLAMTGIHYYVRKSALNRLNGTEHFVLFSDVYHRDTSLEVQALALDKMYSVDTSRAVELAEMVWYGIEFNHDLHQHYLTAAVANILANTGSTLYTDYFRSACKDGNVWVRGEIQKPLIVWLHKIPVKERVTFLNYLTLFEGEYKAVINEFGPKQPKQK